MIITPKFKTGDRVIKGGGDYTFEGVVVAAFFKRSGAVRYVVEDDRGLLFIFNELALQMVKTREDMEVEKWEELSSARRTLAGGSGSK